MVEIERLRIHCEYSHRDRMSLHQMLVTFKDKTFCLQAYRIKTGSRVYQTRMLTWLGAGSVSMMFLWVYIQAPLDFAVKRAMVIPSRAG